jgi:hypothetical protein
MISVRGLRAFFALVGLAGVAFISLNRPGALLSKSTHNGLALAAAGGLFGGLRGARRQLLIHPNAIPVGLKGSGEHAKIKFFWVSLCDELTTYKEMYPNPRARHPESLPSACTPAISIFRFRGRKKPNAITGMAKKCLQSRTAARRCLDSAFLKSASRKVS